MQDPHVDLAMFSIYSFYSREQIDRLIDIYFRGNCPEKLERKYTVMCRYAACCGATGANIRGIWSGFRRIFIETYRYAKEFYKSLPQECEERERIRVEDENRNRKRGKENA